jgi:hypothetical protein
MSTSDLESFVLRDKVEDAVIEAGGWENVAEGGYYSPGLPEGMTIIQRDLDEGREDYYDSPHSQGHEGVCFVVIEHEGRFFRKTGTTDSYARRNWGGPLREVKKGEVQVVKYEWVEA